MSYKRPGVIKLKPQPHSGQLKLLKLLEAHRFVLATCGRRFGKTLFLLLYMLRFAINNPGINGWWIDAIQYLAKRAFRLMEKAVRNAGLATDGGISKSELRIELITGSVLEFHSAERGDRLRGEGVHLACLNEASLIKEALWYEAVYPMLTDTGGHAAFAFTPQGQGHFTYKLFQDGRNPEKPDYASLQLPTTANPHINPAMVAQAKLDLPNEVYCQEYLAEFRPDSSGVFRNIQACTMGSLDSIHTIPMNGPYVGGLDLAKHEDFTVLSILDARGRLAWHERMQRQDWPVMKARVIDAAKRYKAHLTVEQNHVGDVVLDDLREAGVSCEGFSTTGKSKQGLIQELMIALERALISFPDIPELLTELAIFEYNRMPSGHIQYSAPQGAHDDEVMALALAVHGFTRMSKLHKPGWLQNGLDGIFNQKAAA